MCGLPQRIELLRQDADHTAAQYRAALESARVAGQERDAALAQARALGELAIRGSHLTWCHSLCNPSVDCTCGTDSHNAKVRALVGDR